MSPVPSNTPAAPAWEHYGRLFIGIVMLIALLLPWAHGCSTDPGAREKYSGMEVVMTAATGLFVNHDFDDALLTVPMALLPLLPMALVLSVRYPLFTRSFIGTVAVYYVFYCLFARYDLAKGDRPMLLGFWLYFWGSIAASGLSIAASIIQSRQRARPPVPS